MSFTDFLTICQILEISCWVQVSHFSCLTEFKHYTRDIQQIIVKQELLESESAVILFGVTGPLLSRSESSDKKRTDHMDLKQRENQKDERER
jgi:hypothetical protein